MLKSKLLSSDPRLTACETSDPAHVKPGDQGNFVKRIQTALIRIDDASIDDADMVKGLYGPSTAAAVLSYKTKRKIINTAYQKTPDNIVGKMTIRRLDDEMVPLEVGSSDGFVAGGLRPIAGRLL